MPILKESKSKLGTKRQMVVQISKELGDRVALASIACETSKIAIITAALEGYIDQTKEELIGIICDKVEEQWKKPGMKKQNQGRLDRFLRKVCRELSPVYMEEATFIELCAAIKKRMLYEGELWDERY